MTEEEKANAFDLATAIAQRVGVEHDDMGLVSVLVNVLNELRYMTPGEIFERLEASKFVDGIGYFDHYRVEVGLSGAVTIKTTLEAIAGDGDYDYPAVVIDYIRDQVCKAQPEEEE